MIKSRKINELRHVLMRPQQLFFWWRSSVTCCVLVTGAHVYLHCVGLLRMLEMDDTEEQGILGTVEQH